jgi:hypothetical protein
MPIDSQLNFVITDGIPRQGRLRLAWPLLPMTKSGPFPIHAVVLDCDGVLLDTLEAAVEVARRRPADATRLGSREKSRWNFASVRSAVMSVCGPHDACSPTSLNDAVRGRERSRDRENLEDM